MHHVLNYLLLSSYFLFLVTLNHLSTRCSVLLLFEDTGIALLILEDPQQCSNPRRTYPLVPLGNELLSPLIPN